MERIQKLLARAGLGSRREVEDWIRGGVVRRNDSVATLGEQVGAGDRLTVRGYHYRVEQGDGRSRTLEEVGRVFGITRERIRQIEARALRKLRLPSRVIKLRCYLAEGPS